MRFFRNPEVKKSIAIYGIITAAAAAGGWIYNPALGLLLFLTGLVYLALYILFTFCRYQRLAEMGKRIDSILHGEKLVPESKYREGELAVLENELNKMIIRLYEQKELLEKDKLYLQDSIADISHQLKTPLTAMNLILSLLEDPELSKEQRFGYRKELEGHISHLDWLISTLLKLSRLDAGTANLQVRRVDAAKLIRVVVTPLEIPMELRGLSLRTEIEEGVSFDGDLSWTAEAVANILKNCMEHTPPGGVIHIEASENPIYTEFVISDNGEGISEEDLPHLFERFYRGKNSSDTSVGIGLALARTVITSQRGTVKAENRKDGGAAFTIRFYKSVV